MKLILGFIVAVIIIVILVYPYPDTQTVEERDRETWRQERIETSKELEYQDALLQREIENLRYQEQRYQEWYDDAFR